ncbi:hypothetical protein [Streptosporangium sp. KLBMP 9127]|nr:hypothetical protein [Streptosporangium sp. KLBMP 9127]
MTVAPVSPAPQNAAPATMAATGPPLTLPPGPPSDERTPRRRTVPGRVRTLTGVAVVAVALLFGATALAIGNVRDGLQVIGHDAGPQVVATADLYFALSDMDAQIANVLLIGRETSLGKGRQQALTRYDQRRAEASRAVLQAAELTIGDPTEQRTVRSVLDGLGRYERLASQALLLDEQARHPAGPPPQRVIDIYRQATDLMRLDLLPKAYNLTLDSGTIVRETYEEERAAVLTGRILVAVAGLGTLAVLIALQIFLARRFRRVTNPALLLATLATAGLTLAGWLLLSQEADDLRMAKENGFNSVLSLSRARAIGNTMHGDQSRYLLDPGRADTYEQVYLDKSQSVLYTPGGNLDKYYVGVDNAVSAFPDKSDFLGFHGIEANNITLPAQSEAVADVLKGYQRFQQDDRRMRQLALAGQSRQAIAHRMGPLSDSFESYDKSLVGLTGLHGQAFDRAIENGDGSLGGWNLILPGASLLIALLIAAGVWPRLSEYR